MPEQSPAAGGEVVIASQPAPQPAPVRSTPGKPCRYYASKSGCRAGNACPFRHDAASATAIKRSDGSEQTPSSDAGSEPKASRTLPDRRRYQAPSVPASRVVQRPVPAAQLEDPHEFQLGQIRRRFMPVEKAERSGSSFTFNLSPSDPDFPYEIESVQCNLHVPRDYPAGSRPTLRVLNKDIPRGFQINIEQGFDEIATAAPEATLLGLFNRLDNALADLLSRPMAETIKLYRPSAGPQKPETIPVHSPAIVTPQTTVTKATPRIPSWTDAEKSDAAQKRQTDVRQLVARLGKSPGFVQSADGVTFTLPPTVFRTPNAPSSVVQASSLQLIVPQMYPLVKPRVQFGGSRPDEVTNVEAAFEIKAESQQAASLLAQVNYLSLNLKQMALMTKVSNPPAPPAQRAPPTTTEAPSPQAPQDAAPAASDKPHVHIIPRPIEWMQTSHDDDDDDDDDGDDTSDDSYSEDSSDDSDISDAPADEAINMPTTGVAERGVLLSFPNLELHGIELLELTSLSLTVKCNRCKELSDFERLRNNVQADHTGMKEQGCKKCASSLAAGYRMDLIHVNSSRAGYIDLDGCTAVDMLPSTFVPTCGECSTAYATPGCVSVRGDSTLAVCRECHRKMSFRIHEVKFLMVSAAAERATQGPIRKKVKENLGIVAGQELPRRGKCQHYAKSYRWFRFACCSKVFPCDKCHDKANPDHAVEFANRMICGYCSREQNYRPEDCRFCHQVLIGKRGSGFWEGGKGTRDPARMSRKDPRKYKRRPGTKPKS